MRFALSLLLLVSVSWGQDTQSGSVYYNSGSNSYSITFGKIDPTAAAWGTFENTLNQTGWGVLTIQTAPASSNYSDNQRMFALGYLEGALTAQHIAEMAVNMNDEFFGSAFTQPPANLVAWFTQQEQYNYAQVQANPTDPFWQQIGFTNNQFEGVIAGYMANPPSSAPAKLARANFQVINGVGDLLDLMSVLGFTKGRYGLKDWLKLSPEEFEQLAFRRGMCSAIVKVNGDYSDLFAAQSAWFTYSAMNRIFKFYKMDLAATFLAATEITFSSYPGMLSSLDDFYIMNSGLTMIQTTNGVYNTSLYKLVVPQSLLAWQRVRAANAMAGDGETWYNTVGRENSGTYNNQYMVVNYNLFKPGVPLQNGTLWVCEQIPGTVVGADLTWTLERGYFSSYNVPYFYDIYVASGYPDVVDKYGYSYSYQLAPRAEIFRRDQATVSDLDSLKALMRYNDYKHDPYAKNNPMYAICSRGDLISPHPQLGGCYDTKVTNYAMQAKLQSEAVNGPTQSHGLPAFQWTPAFDGTAHYGEPSVFNFDFVPMQPNFT